MDKLKTSSLKLGIIAGGQLGKMLIQEASKWDILTYVLDNEEHCPARSIASHYVKGSHLDYESVYQFGKLVDVLTYEIESINIDALKKLKTEGCRVVPDPDVLEIIQDKGLQKDFFKRNCIPTAEFSSFDAPEYIIEKIEAGLIDFPFVQKIRKGGYDGRGVAIITNKNDLTKLLSGDSIVERKIPIDKEVSVIVARNKQGEVRAYPAVEMIFDPKVNLVDRLICPSSISEEQSVKVLNYATNIINVLEMEGLLAIEFFIDSEGNVIVNEMAPRPHNSGHHTIESNMTSQFEQHLRAILSLPLGSTEILLPSVMINIVGSPGHDGHVWYEGLIESMAIEGVKIHLYGKKITKPYRKMGHVTVLSSTLESAKTKADQVKNVLKVKSWKGN
ncbi:MAG: 5-(carboxyamino)imidazole ribonucleotide synthase [Candidatus Cloacimonetes bacterium]|nr:5-(carboxyamino)imidazole ribonucleotide synthase [Candidatus Cloacimonadota bacterium]